MSYYEPIICNRKGTRFQRSIFGAKFLRPQCRLSDARQTIGLFVGPCPEAATAETGRQQLRRVVCGHSRQIFAERDDRFSTRIANPIVRVNSVKHSQKSIDSMMQLKRSINRAKNTKPKNSL